MKETIHVGIVGSYGGFNLGDEAILQVIITEVRRHVPTKITVFSRNPEDTRSRHDIERAVSLERLTRDELRPEVERLDVLICGGGGILFDTYAQVSLRPVQIAQDLQIPVMLYAVGAGPLHDPAEQQLVRDCLNRAQAITVRARASRTLLEEIGVRVPIEVTADPAFLLEPEPLPPDAATREGLTGERRFVGISVREPGPAAPDLNEQQYHALLANAADFMVDRYDAHIVFVPMERHVLDMQHAHAVIAQMAFADRATVLKGDYTPSQMVTLMDSFTLAVGMRLHFFIFAALRRVPFVALPYARKVASLLEDFQIPMPPLKVVNAGRLMAHIDRSWDMRDEYRARIDRMLPDIQARASRSHEIFLRVLEERLRVTSRASQEE